MTLQNNKAAIMKLNNEEMGQLHCMSPEQRAKALMKFSADDRMTALQMLNDRDRLATLAVMPKDDLYAIDMRRGGLSHHGQLIKRDQRGIGLTMRGAPQVRPMNTFPQIVKGHLPPPQPEDLAHALPFGGYPERLVGQGMGVGRSGLEYQNRSVRNVFEHSLGEMGPGAQPVVHKVPPHPNGTNPTRLRAPCGDGLSSFGRLTPPPSPFLPQVAQLAMSQNLVTRGTAARTMGGMGPRGIPYIQLLATMLEDSAMEATMPQPQPQP